MLPQLIKDLTIFILLSNNSLYFISLAHDVPYLNRSNMKFILAFTLSDDYSAPFTEINYDLQSDPFRDQSCEYQNCYYTSEKELLGSEADFHAILFYGPSLPYDLLPKERNEFQYYVVVMDECIANVKGDRCYWNNFFNLTATYRLDSDIPTPFFKVIDKTDNNTVVGPRINMKWKESPKILTKEYLSKLYGKTELAAWFVSNCYARNNRSNFVHNLNQEIMARSNLTIDIFGRCGDLKCPSEELPTREVCDQLLSEAYLFYIAFENSDDVDYITEKVARAVRNDAVPVVYGGADYTRFLPPGSYIDAKELGPTKTAIVLIYLYTNREAYSKFFYWKNTYEYRDNNYIGFSCELCAILNSNSSEPRTHPRFTDWWSGWNTSSSSEPDSIHCIYDPEFNEEVW